MRAQSRLSNSVKLLIVRCRTNVARAHLSSRPSNPADDKMANTFRLMRSRSGGANGSVSVGIDVTPDDRHASRKRHRATFAAVHQQTRMNTLTSSLTNAPVIDRRKQSDQLVVGQPCFGVTPVGFENKALKFGEDGWRRCRYLACVWIRHASHSPGWEHRQLIAHRFDPQPHLKHQTESEWKHRRAPQCGQRCEIPPPSLCLIAAPTGPVDALPIAGTQSNAGMYIVLGQPGSGHRRR